MHISKKDLVNHQTVHSEIMQQCNKILRAYDNCELKPEKKATNFEVLKLDDGWVVCVEAYHRLRNGDKVGDTYVFPINMLNMDDEELYAEFSRMKTPHHPRCPFCGGRIAID